MREKKRKVLRNANLKLRQQLGSANDCPKQQKAKLAEIAIKVSK